MIRGNETAADVLRTTLAQAQRELVQCLSALAERPDPEAVHKARIDVRRLRSVLRTFAPVIDQSWCDDWRERLEGFGRALGIARDAAAIVEVLQEASEHLSAEHRESLGPLIEESQIREREAERALRAFLTTEDARDLLTALDEAAAIPHLGARAADPLRRVVPQIMHALQKDACRRARRARRHPSDRRLHRLRIAAKHLRYAAETLSDTYGKRAQRFSDLAARLQTILGDARDAMAALRAIARRSDGELPLCHVEAYLAKKAREAAARWPKHWKRLKKRKNRFWRARI